MGAHYHRRRRHHHQHRWFVHLRHLPPPLRCPSGSRRHQRHLRRPFAPL